MYSNQKQCMLSQDLETKGLQYCLPVYGVTKKRCLHGSE